MANPVLLGTIVVAVILNGWCPRISSLHSAHYTATRRSEGDADLTFPLSPLKIHSYSLQECMRLLQGDLWLPLLQGEPNLIILLTLMPRMALSTS